MKPVVNVVSPSPQHAALPAPHVGRPVADTDASVLRAAVVTTQRELATACASTLLLLAVTMTASFAAPQAVAQDAPPAPSRAASDAMAGGAASSPGSILPAGAAAAAAVPTAASCAAVARYAGITQPPLNATNCNLPDADAARRRAASEEMLSRTRGEALSISWSRDGVPADGQSAVVLRVEALDRDGKPLARPVRVTVEASRGRIDGADLASRASQPRFLADRDRREPGVQLVLDAGVGETVLIAPHEAGDAILRVSSGDLEVEGRLSFLPDLRPAIAVGIVEGQAHLAKRSTGANTPAIEDDGLEAELSALDRDEDGDTISSFNGRAAFFYKGVVRDELLLTAAYDSDKDRTRLFRDIQPDQFYPIYGDSSLKGFEAQSTGRGYLRLERGKSYLLGGDFLTEGGGNSLRDLGQYSRSLNGLRTHYENGRLQFNAWGARDSARQVIDEQPGRGVSGPYEVSTPDGIANSEKVEIVVRDRSQPSIVLSVQPLIRYTDYEFEPFTGRLLLRKPVPSLDANLNPVSIRVTYEVDEGGPDFNTFGADLQIRPFESFELGLSYARADDPAEPYGIGSINAAWQLGRRTTWVAELARTERDASLVQTLSEGHGFRTELRHAGEKLDARLFYGRTTDDFDNPSATLDGGRDEAGGKLTWRFTEATDFTAEALQTEDVRVGASRRGATATVGHWLNQIFRIEAGLRWFDDEVSADAASSIHTTYSSVYSLMPAGSLGAGAFVNGATPSSGQNTTARLKLIARAGEKALVYVEGEQGLDDSDAYALAVGGEYQVLEKARLYARHELADSLSGFYGLDEDESRRATVFGVDSAYSDDASLFSEYRLRSAIPGRESEAAVGLRNLWPLRPGLAFSTALERVQVFDGSHRDATAAAFGVESTRREQAKASARFEYRTDEAADTWLSTLAYTRKLSRDWSLLARNLYSLSEGEDPALGELMQNRGIVGLAWRETDRNLWNALLRYEVKLERDTGTADPFERTAHVISMHANYHPRRPLTLAAQLAAKQVDETFGRGAGSIDDEFRAWLVGGRVIYDLTERWDLGLHASSLMSSGSRQYGIGLETGYALIDNLWLSVGFNFLGFSDDDLVDSDYTARGAYLRLRYKFDEKLFRGDDPRWNNSLAPAGRAQSAPLEQRAP